MRCSTAISTRPADLPRSRQADRARRRRREARALRRDDHRHRQPTQRRRTEREAAEGLLCARQERPADRPRQVDDQRVDRVYRRAQRCRRAARLARRRDDRRCSRPDPEIIIASDAEFAAKVHGDPDWAAIGAVKSGRVYLSPKLPFGWTDFPPAVNRLIGLWWLGKIFYPDRFPEDIKAMTRDFYTMFLRDPERGADRARVGQLRLNEPGRLSAPGNSADGRRRTRRRGSAADGRRRQGPHPRRRHDHSGTRDCPLRSAMQSACPQCQRRRCTLRRYRPCGRRRQRAGSRRSPRRHFASLDWAATMRHRSHGL